MDYPFSQQHQFPQHSSPPASGPSSNPSPAIMDADTKILSDLSTVNEKITLCHSMLTNIHHTSEIDTNEPLLTIIGFLEACVPRVRELIDIGMNSSGGGRGGVASLLKEETLTKCFQVNDDLCKILEDVEHPENVIPVQKEASVSTENAATATAADNSTTNVDDFLDSLDFDSFGFEDKKRAVTESDGDDTNLKSGDDDITAQAASSAIAASTLEDLLAPPTSTSTLTSTPSLTSKPESTASPTKTPKDEKNDKKAKNKDDDFDDFFDNRMNQSNSFSIDE